MSRILGNTVIKGTLNIQTLSTGSTGTTITDMGVDSNGDVVGALTVSAPTEVSINTFVWPDYIMDLEPLESNLISLSLSNLTLKKLTIPKISHTLIGQGFNSSNITNITLTGTDPLEVDLNGWTVVKQFALGSTTGVAGGSVTWTPFEASPVLNTLEELDISNWDNSVQPFTIGDLNKPVLNFLSINNVNITSFPTITNAPNLADITVRNTDIVVFDDILGSGLPACTQFQGVLNSLLTTIGDINSSALQNVSFSNCPLLTTVGSLTGCTSLTNFEIGGAAITDTNIMSQILIDLDANGTSNGYFNAQGGTNVGVGGLTGGGATARTNLLGKSWTLDMNA